MLSRAALCLVLVGCAGHRHVPTLAAGLRAYEHYDLEASRRAYRALIASPASGAVDRIAAHRALARSAWKFDADLPGARRELERARRLTREPSALWAQQAGIELEAGLLADAQHSAELGHASARGDAEVVEASLVLGQVLLAGGGEDALARSARLLREVLALRPGHIEASDALLGVAIQLDDGPLALVAWRSYFWIADGGTVPGTLERPHAELTALASRWRGRPLGDADRRLLAIALGESRRYGHAAQVARTTVDPGPVLLGMLAYDAFLDRVARVNRDFYPRIARGLRDYTGAYDRAIVEAARPLWSALHPGAAPAFDPDAFFALIRDRFGAEGYLGVTVGFYGMLMGHVIHDERRRISQYGHDSEIRYLMIDRGVSTDFTSWYGTTNVGGWGDASTIVQVRPAYTAEPFERLTWVTDARARSAVTDRLGRLVHDDLQRCGRDPYAPPTSVSLALRLAASDRLHERLVANGLSGQALALAFVAESSRLNVEATVFAHEGRHAIDQRHFAREFDAMTDDERELRAKLSEVAFASDPKLALTGSVIGAQLDESTGHGRANRRFRRLLVDWMTAHRSEIAGLDPRTPMILQLHLLTDGQLRGIARDADPLASDPRGD